VYRFTLLHNEFILRKGLACLEIDDCHLDGALYLTNERLVFVGNKSGMGKAKYKLEIDLAHIEMIKAGKTFGLIPNVVFINTFQGGRYKVIVRDRDQWIARTTIQMDKV
jgi:hypothetical protein